MSLVYTPGAGTAPPNRGLVLLGIGVEIAVVEGGYALLTKEGSPAEINAAMKKYAEGAMKGILAYTEEQLVSTDLRGNPYSSIFSAVDTVGVGNLVKVVAWYDNEWGYSCRIADICQFLADKGL